MIDFKHFFNMSFIFRDVVQADKIRWLAKGSSERTCELWRD